MIQIVRHLFLTIILGFLILPVSAAKAEQQTPLRFCVEDGEFPPFNYYQRTNGKKGPSSGYDIDLLERVFKPEGIKYEVIDLPWKRCLKAVKEGAIDAAMSASLNPQRARDYLPSEAYYYLKPSYFYLDSDFPEGLEISEISELEALGTPCGITGFNYENFGWKKDRTLYEIDRISQLPAMLKKHRCQFFFAREKILDATLAINGLTSFQQQLKGHAVPHITPESFHMLISYNSKHKTLISTLFNTKVKQLERNGVLAELLLHHLNKIQQAADR